MDLQQAVIRDKRDTITTKGKGIPVVSVFSSDKTVVVHARLIAQQGCGLR